MSPSLSPRHAAAMLSVSESTVRRWCDQRRLPTTRTAGGHQRIELTDLLAFARREALPIRGRAAGEAMSRPSLEAIAAKLYESFCNGDALTVRRLLTSPMAQTLRAEALCDDAICTAMHRLGEAWQRSELDVYQEHAATQAVEAALWALHNSSFPGLGRHAVCAGLSGDPYSIGTAMAALVLQGSGFRVTALGTNTPALEVVRAAANVGATLIALSVGAVPDREKFLSQFTVLSEQARERDILVAVGGRGLTRELRKKMVADFFGDSMTHLAGFARSTKRKTIHGNNDSA